MRNKGKLLTKVANKDIIEVEKDLKIKSYLKRVSDGEMIETEVINIKIKKGQFLDWIFNWYRESKKNQIIRALILKDTREIVGLYLLKIY